MYAEIQKNHGGTKLKKSKVKKIKSFVVLGISCLLSLILTDLTGLFEPVLLPNKDNDEEEGYE